MAQSPRLVKMPKRTVWLQSCPCLHRHLASTRHSSAAHVAGWPCYNNSHLPRGTYSALPSMLVQAFTSYTNALVLKGNWSFSEIIKFLKYCVRLREEEDSFQDLAIWTCSQSNVMWFSKLGRLQLLIQMIIFLQGSGFSCKKLATAMERSGDSSIVYH